MCTSGIFVLLASFCTAAAFKLDGIVNGWNTSVGTASQRSAAAEKFNTTVTDDDGLWSNNVMTAFIGKTMHMTDINITQRNAFNTIIEKSVKTGTVLWTVEAGPPGVFAIMEEHINGKYTGVAYTAGWASRNTWIEYDNKEVFGFKIKYDWGIATALSATDTTLVLEYWSYLKGKFIMTWKLKEEEVSVKEPVRPCHAILKGYYGPLCVEENRAGSCETIGYTPFSCTASGWPVCCIGHSGGDSNNPYWYKADQKCSDLHPDGAAPFELCKGEPLLV